MIDSSRANTRQRPYSLYIGCVVIGELTIVLVPVQYREADHVLVTGLDVARKIKATGVDRCPTISIDRACIIIVLLGTIGLRAELVHPAVLAG